MASSNSELDRFVRDAMLAGQSRDAIRNALLAAGWTAEQLAGALDDYADVAFPVPVPKPRASLSSRDAFLYLVLFSLLYVLCYHLGSLLFDLINAALPDAADPAYRYDFFSSTRFSTAALIITFPLFAWMARLVGRETERAPIKRFSPVRRWLTCLTLFVSATAIIGDLTVLVYNVLGGELSVRFVLKVLVVALIAGSVFGYYLWDLRREESETHAWRAMGKRLLIAAGIVAIAALVGGFLLMGSPSTQRAQRMDQRRVSDLQQIEAMVRAHVDETGRLPTDLATLAAKPGVGLSIVDPETGKPYVYRIDDPLRFSLCAEFVTDTAARTRGGRAWPMSMEWAHGIGNTCFTRRIETPSEREAAVDAAAQAAKRAAIQAQQPDRSP